MKQNLTITCKIPFKFKKIIFAYSFQNFETPRAILPVMAPERRLLELDKVASPCLPVADDIFGKKRSGHNQEG